MKQVRTTVRLDENLMKAMRLATVKEGLSQRELISRAVEDYLRKMAKKKAKRILRLPTGDLGESLDNLGREFYYR